MNKYLKKAVSKGKIERPKKKFNKLTYKLL